MRLTAVHRMFIWNQNNDFLQLAFCPVWSFKKPNQNIVLQVHVPNPYFTNPFKIVKIEIESIIGNFITFYSPVPVFNIKLRPFKEKYYRDGNGCTHLEFGTVFSRFFCLWEKLKSIISPPPPLIDRLRQYVLLHDFRIIHSRHVSSLDNVSTQRFCICPVSWLTNICKSEMEIVFIKKILVSTIAFNV